MMATPNGALRFSFVRHAFYNITGFGGRALRRSASPAAVAASGHFARAMTKDEFLRDPVRWC